MNKLLEIHDVTMEYDRKHIALKNVNLSIGRGKIIGLLGTNGSGKTTLIKTINGLLFPTGGEVLINGLKPGIESKAIISYLPERTYFQNTARVEHLISYFKDFYADFREDRAREMLANLNIDTKSIIKTLSKGTREKIQLILVMSRDAELYILDEPIAGVDPAARDYIIRTIINNYNENATVLLSTHLIADVEQILDEVIFIKDGVITLHKTVEEIREQYGKSIDAYFREVFAC